MVNTEIKEQASAKAFAKLRKAQIELKSIADSNINYNDFGTSKERAIDFAQKEVDVWKYITLLIESDM